MTERCSCCLKQQVVRPSGWPDSSRPDRGFTEGSVYRLWHQGYRCALSVTQCILGDPSLICLVQAKELGHKSGMCARMGVAVSDVLQATGQAQQRIAAGKGMCVW